MTRRGSIYIMVLVTSAFVLATGLAALSLEQRVHERSGLNTRVGSARIAVRTGLDLALQMIADDPAWRATVAANGLYLSRDIDTGDEVHTVKVYATDSDGDIDDGDLDPFTLRVMATQADTRRSLQVELQPTPLFADILLFGAYANDNVEAGNLSYVNGNAGIASKMDFKGTGATYFVPVETEKNLSDATFVSTALAGAPAREFVADPDHVDDLYATYGTLIGESDLSYDGTAYVIENMAIGPGRNPFGLLGILSPDNVYVIDHGAKDIIVRDSRIVATVVFLGGGKVIVEGSVNWAPATPGWPAIATDSDIYFRTTSDSLSEAVTLTNFNPVGFGGSGSEDLDLADSYQSQIEGIVYTRSKAIVETGSARFVGHLVTKNDIIVNPGAILELRASRDSTDNVPPGFESQSRFEMIPLQWLDP